MIYSRRYISRNRISILLCAVFLISLIVAPSIHSQTIDATSVMAGSNRGGGIKLPILQESKTYLISETAGNEFVNDIRSSFLSNRSFQSFQNILLRILNILLPFVGFCVMIYCFGYFNRRNTKHKSIMAGSLGGHDPPQVM